jgi:hypothetical protein
MVHLYSGVPSAQVASSGVQFNDQVMATDEKKVNVAAGYEAHLVDVEWPVVQEYILNATDDNGDVIEGGDFFLKGIKINVSEEDAYRPDELEVKCYEVSELYAASPEEMETEEEAAPVEYKDVKLPKPLKNMFVIDEEAWKNGEVVIKVHPEFDGSSLTGTAGNLIRIDICVKRSKENFSENENIGGNFKFNSPYGFNTSVYESLKQTLKDPSISPENSGNTVIYSVYISSFTL